MKFTFANIVKEGEVKKGDTIFVPPYFLHKSHSDCSGDYDIGDFYANYAGINRFYGKYESPTAFYAANGGFYALARFIPLKYSFYDLTQFANANPHCGTIMPNEEENKVLSAILRVIKPSKDTKVFISQAFLDQHSGYDGYSIFFGYGKVGVGWNNLYAFADIKPETDYAKVFAQFDSRYKDGMPLSVDSYKGIVKTTLENGYTLAKGRIDREKRDLDHLIRKYAENIRYNKDKYRGYIATAKKIEEEKQRLSPEMQRLLERGFSEYSMAADEAKSWAQSCNSTVKRRLDVVNNLNFIKASRKKMGEDFKAVKKLIKSGIIESIAYKPGEGMNWTYSPLVYEYTRGHKAFLGRIKITISEVVGDTPFRIKMISYKEGSGCYSWHYGSTDISYCLGQFEPILYNLMAMGKVSDLILVFRDYLLSSNESSKLNKGPRYDLMSLTNPLVIDDSFKVWKAKEDAKNAKTEAVPETQKA